MVIQLFIAGFLIGDGWLWRGYDKGNDQRGEERRESRLIEQGCMRGSQVRKTRVLFYLLVTLAYEPVRSCLDFAAIAYEQY